MPHLHVGELLHGGEAGEVQPGDVLPVLVVIPLVLEVPEGRSPQSVQLHGVLLPLRTGDDVNIYGGMGGEVRLHVISTRLPDLHLHNVVKLYLQQCDYNCVIVVAYRVLENI